MARVKSVDVWGMARLKEEGAGGGVAREKEEGEKGGKEGRSAWKKRRRKNTKENLRGEPGVTSCQKILREKNRANL